MFIAVLALLQGASQPQRVELRQPVSTLSAEFSQVRGVRELPDGRLLVSDRLEQRVAAYDPKTGRSTTIGRVGSGPAEYRLPTALFPVGGDSTLLIDEGNSRIGVIGPDLKLDRVFQMMLPGLSFPVGARGRDAAGRYIVQIPGWMRSRGPKNDSVLVVRFDMKAGRVDTLAIVKGTTPPPHPEYSPVPRIPYEIFAPQDGWVVAADGAVAIVRSGDYHVEWIDAHGNVTRGPPIPFETIPVTPAERVAYAKRFAENSSIGGKSPEGLVAASPQELAIDRVTDLAAASTFSAAKGAFTDAALKVGVDGSLWVERSVAFGSPPLYDVFDRGGRRVKQVQLPRGRRLTALGRNTAYLIFADDDGLEHIELYAI